MYFILHAQQKEERSALYLEECTVDYLNKNVAQNLRRLRKSKQMSLDDVAHETGLSKSMLGQIERGEANPTLGTIEKIVNGLRVTFLDLIGAPKDSNCIIRGNSLTPIKEELQAYSSKVYFPYEQGRNFEIYYITVEPGKAYRCASHGEHTMEYLLVVSGELLLEVSEETYCLSAGDAIRFNTDCSHAYHCKGTKQLHLFSVFHWT